MPERLDYLQIRKPADANSIRGFIDKHRSLGIEGYERIEDQTGALCFMLGYEDERTRKPVFVAGVRTDIWEFRDLIEGRVRKALGMGNG